MSYLVLARKYRPQTFAEVAGQEHVTRTMANAFRQGRVHHAFLLCGPRGVGKTTLARILGKALNCEKGPSAEPCGVCEPCAGIASGTAVDYYEMDGASNRGIDAIRELTDAVKYQPAAMRKKVYVIDEVHMLTTEAFNALLKTLEEPPPHVTFILATTEPHKVPVTILSRCQRYDFKLVPGPRLAAHLRSIFEAESIAVEPAAVDLLVRESGGSVRDALSLSDQVISYVGAQEISEAQVAEVLGVADRALVRSLVESVARGDARTALEVVDSAVARGLDEVQVARALTRVLHDIAVAQVDARVVDAGEEELAELGRLGRELDPTRVRLMCDRMMRACEDLAESPEPRIVVDLALIDLAALDSVPPLAELVERLVELERRLAGGAGGPGGAPRRAPPRGGASKAPPASASSASAAGGAPSSATAGGVPPGNASPSSASPSSAASSSAAPRNGMAASATSTSASPGTAAPTSAAAAAAAVNASPANASSANASLANAPLTHPAPASTMSAHGSGASGAPSTEMPASAAPASTMSAHGSGASAAPAHATPVAAPGASASPGSAASAYPAPARLAPAAIPRGPGQSSQAARPSASPVASSAAAARPVASSAAAARPAVAPAARPSPSAPASPPASPAPAARPASAPAPGRAPGDPLRAWAEVMTALEEARELTLLSWYQHAVVLRWDEKGVEIGFPAGAIVSDLATEPRNVDALGKFLRQHAGGPVALSVRVLSEADRSAVDSARSIVEAEAERRRDETVRRTAEAREHPTTKMVLDTFGASIEEIKTDV